MNWPMVQLQELARPEKGSIVSGPFGSNIGSRFFVEEGIPVIRGNNLTVGREKFIDEGFVFLTEEKATEFKNCEAKKYDIIFTAAGTIGQVGLIPENTKFEKYIISNKQLRVRIDTSKANPVFVYYWLTTREMNRHIIGLNNGGAVPLINLSIIRKLPIPLPPYEKQDRIVSIISAYDSLIENNRRRIQLLEQSARLFYREWFVNLRFPGHEHVRIIDGVPERWRKKKLKEIADVNAISLNNGFQEKIEYIDISSVTTGQINETTLYEFKDAPGRARRLVRHGDIIWSCVRPNRESHAIIWNPRKNLIASTGFAVISPIEAPTSYIYQALTTKEFVGYLTNNARGVAYPAVTGKDVESAEILIPTNSLLEQFDGTVKATIEQINLLKMQNNKLKEARDILLPRLMNGEIAV